MRRTLVALAFAVAAPSAAHALDWPRRAEAAAQAYASPGADARRAAVQQLAELDVADAVTLLRLALDDPDASVRETAATVAGALRADAVTDVLMERLADRNADVRVAAAEALGQLRAPQLVDPLARALADNDSDVRVAAVQSLSTLGTPDAVLAIVGMLHDSDRDVVVAALAALGHLGQPGTVFAVLEKIHDPSEEVAIAALEVIAVLRPTEAIPAVVELTQTGRPAVAVAAIQTLGAIGSYNATSALVREAVSPRVEGASAAAIASLTSIADPRAAVLLAPRVPATTADLGPVFAATAPSSWSPLADEWARAGTVSGRDALLGTWLASGDPRAVDVATSELELLGASAAEIQVYLARSPAPEAFCRAYEARSLPADGDALDAAASWAMRVGAVDCFDEALLRDGAVLVDAGLAARLAAAGSERGMETARAINLDLLDANDAAELGAALNRRGVAGAQLLTRLLWSDDPSVRREGALALAEMREPWADQATVTALLSGAARRPELLVALAGQLDGPQAPAIVETAQRLFADGAPDAQIEAMTVLAQRCGAVDAGSLGHAVRSDDLWVRRAGYTLAAACGSTEVLRDGIAATDRAIRALAISTVDVDGLETIARDDQSTVDERVAALSALCVADPARCAVVGADSTHARDAALAAASWLAVSHGADPGELATMLLDAAASDRAVERSAIYLAAHRLGATDALVGPGRSETHPVARRVLQHGADAFGDELTLEFVDPVSGAARQNEAVFVVWDDGRMAIVRTDAAGRVRLVGTDVAFALHVDASDQTTFWPAPR